MNIDMAYIHPIVTVVPIVLHSTSQTVELQIHCSRSLGLNSNTCRNIDIQNINTVLNLFLGWHLLPPHQFRALHYLYVLVPVVYKCGFT